MGRPGGLGEQGFLVDVQGIAQRGGHAVLNDRPADRAEVVAHTAVEGGLVRLHFLADSTAHGLLAALAARAVVEERTEPRRRCERGLEHAAAALEQRSLVERE